MSTHERHPSIGTKNFGQAKDVQEFEWISGKSTKRDSTNILQKIL